MKAAIFDNTYLVTFRPKCSHPSEQWETSAQSSICDFSCHS